MTSRLDVGRPFFGPPEITPARAAALRRAFEATMKDPAFLADAAKLGLETNPMTGEEVAQSVTDVLATPADVVENVKDALEGR
jgi:tripartite-type tricarboxylate transporter receptor subunit TctC